MIRSKITMFFLLCYFVVCVADENQLLEGYLQAKDTGKFLECKSSGCQFVSQSSQATYFKREVGEQGQYSFKVAKGTDYGKCLDRTVCESVLTNFEIFKHDYARLGDCSHCGAKQWNLDGDKLVARSASHCLQNDGKTFRKCDDTYQPMQFFRELEAWSKPQGEWVQIASTSSGSISQGATWGTSTSDRNARTKTWSATLGASANAGVIFAGTTLSASASSSISQALWHTFSRKQSQDCKVTCQADPQHPWIFVYQWQLKAKHTTESQYTTEVVTCNYLCIYSNIGHPRPPRCPFQCCLDKACQQCTSSCFANIRHSHNDDNGIVVVHG